jgi:5-methylcytosine-specific restriction endonuclease McrA
MASAQHSTAAWQRLRLHILERDLWTCRMCGCLLREGRTAPDSAAVDHIRPAELRPDLFWDEGNLRASCRSCHAVADSIEKRLGPDADAIARAKMAYRPIGADGYPVG